MLGFPRARPTARACSTKWGVSLIANAAFPGQGAVPRLSESRAGLAGTGLSHLSLCAFLVDFFSPREIAARTIDALAQPEAFTDLRCRARQAVVERYDLHQIALPAQLELIAEVMQGRRPHLAVYCEVCLGRACTTKHRSAAKWFETLIARSWRTVQTFRE